MNPSMGSMGSMTHPAAMQMSMMQMMGVPPQYLQALQMQQKHKRKEKEARKKERKASQQKGEEEVDGEDGEESSESSSSGDSSSDSSSDEAGGLDPAAAYAAMNAMWQTANAGAAAPLPPMLAPAVGSMPLPVEDVEAYLAANLVEPEAANSLRALPPRLQQYVIQRGPVSDTRNPSAVLIARIRDVELNSTEPSNSMGVASDFVGGGGISRANV